MKLSKTQIVRLVSLLEVNKIDVYQINVLGNEVGISTSCGFDESAFVDSHSGELRNTQHTTIIKARILGCIQSVIVDYDMDKDGSIDIVRMTLEDELFPIEWSRSIEQLVMVELEKHLPKL